MDPAPVPAPARGASDAGVQGVVYALLAYTSWGVMPVYWKALAGLPPLEVLMYRVAGTALFTALLLTLAMALAIALLAYGEPFTRAHAVACIWSALALYTAEPLFRWR